MGSFVFAILLGGEICDHLTVLGVHVCARNVTDKATVGVEDGKAARIGVIKLMHDLLHRVVHTKRCRRLSHQLRQQPSPRHYRQGHFGSRG